jgi:8-oxo-dGTP diphosphatase
MKRRQRVYAYVTHEDRLLVFEHCDFPDAGIQVPAGTVDEGESPDEAVLREVEEETGLSGFNATVFLGSFEHDMREFGVEELQEVFFYHVVCPGAPQERWIHHETSGGRTEPIAFEFYWVQMPDRIPQFVALEGRYLDDLYRLLNIEFGAPE